MQSQIYGKKYENGTYNGSIRTLNFPKNRGNLIFRQGLGTFHFDNGERYEGNWNDDKMDGRGVYTWPNGCKFDGGFKAGQMDGDGFFVWPDGRKYGGNYKAGKSVRGLEKGANCEKSNIEESSSAIGSDKAAQG